MKNNELIVDNFAGGGGASVGIEMALGRSPDVAVNHDREALAMHKANHPQTTHYECDVFEIDPVVVTRNKPVGLAWFSPDCLTGDTLILTKNGLKPLSEVEVGELVLTHRMRWRRVVRTMTSEKPTVIVKGRGHWGLEMSPTHKVPLRFRTELRSRAYKLEHEVDTPIGEGEGRYWSAPIGIPEAVASISLPNDDCDAPEFWWFVGRWLADGSMDTNRVQWTIGDEKVDAMKMNTEAFQIPVFNGNGDPAEWRVRENGAATIFSISSKELQSWLRQHFGEHAENKTVPAWIYQLSIENRLSILNGIESGDGCATTEGGNCGDRQRLSTGSRYLAVGIRLLAESLSFPASIFRGEPRTSTDDSGKSYVGRLPEYEVRWAVTDPKAKRHVIDGSKIWYPIYAGKIVPGKESAILYNLEVEDDHTYLADGIFVCNCTHHSKAKGGKPMRAAGKKSRSLANVVVKWAATVKPRVIFLENVEEFEDWGPVVAKIGDDGEPVFDPSTGEPWYVPCPNGKGKLFKKWVRSLRSLGYQVEWRALRACDYGAPTIRKRLFVIARCDGKPIVWPKPTHGAPDSAGVKSGKLLRWRTAADIIDWSIPCPSIFMDPVEAKSLGLKRPLAAATMKRIAAGVKRYVLDAAEPFIVVCNHGGDWFRGRSVAEPMSTVTCSRDANGLVVPFVSYGQHGGANREADSPMHTVTASRKDCNTVVTPFVSRQFGNSVGHAGDEPLGTVTANGGGKSALIAPVLSAYYGDKKGQPQCCTELHKPLKTQPTENRHALVTAFLAQHNGGMIGHDAREPVSTLTGKCIQQNIVAANLTHMYTSNTRGGSGEPDAPIKTITTGKHAALVASFLAPYYGSGSGETGRDMLEPIPTVTTKDRLQFVTVEIAGEPYVIEDIGMRMLTPRELFRAQGFPDSYKIDPWMNDRLGKNGRVLPAGRLPKQSQVRMCGNSVCPDLAKALVQANLKPVSPRRRRKPQKELALV